LNVISERRDGFDKEGGGEGKSTKRAAKKSDTPGQFRFFVVMGGKEVKGLCEGSGVGWCEEWHGRGASGRSKKVSFVVADKNAVWVT
jgi:hypothetical protein